jgi:Tfp pilus assembly protein PilV
MEIVKQKRAVAMVELIFAMVIIAIVLLSAPMLIHQASKSNNVLLQQEAIAAISAHTSILLSKHWDEADANLSGGVAVSPILKTSNGAGIFDFNVTNTRQGFGDVPGRLTLHQGATLPASIIGDDLNDRDDIDDYHDKNNTVILYSNSESTSATIGDYVDINLNMHTTVRYTRDTPVNFNITSTTNTDINQSIVGTSNVKFVSVHLTSESNVSELNKSIIMNVFSCNIGTVSIEGEQK